MAGAGHGDVDGFAVEAGGSDEEHAVAGDALGLVDGGGVAVVDVAGVRRSRRRGGWRRAVDEREVDAAVAADAVDGADHPVVDPGRAPVAEVDVAGGVGAVAQQDDPVAGLELAAADLEHAAGELVGDRAGGRAG